MCLYLMDNCDNAGFWEVDWEEMAFLTKLKEGELTSHGLETIRGQVLVGKNNKFIWLKSLLRDEKHLPLKPNNNEHKAIIWRIQEMLDEFGVANKKILKALLPEGIILPKSKSDEAAPENSDHPSQTKFTKPTLIEAQQHFKSKKVDDWEVAGEKFVEHYSKVGWVVGKHKTPMKSWKSAINTFIRNQKEWEQNKTGSSKGKGSKAKAALASHEKVKGWDFDKLQKEA